MGEPQKTWELLASHGSLIGGLAPDMTPMIGEAASPSLS